MAVDAGRPTAGKIPPILQLLCACVASDSVVGWQTLESDAATIAMLRERAAATRNDGSVSDAAVEPLRVSAAYQLAEMVRIPLLLSLWIGRLGLPGCALDSCRACCWQGDAGAEVLLEMLLGPDRLRGPSSVAEFADHGWGPVR